ncbi:MAG: hypothetical protein IIB81_04480 [Nanoarchaeota archaeon]|nr:hypothetical protein [Nanoarchaeota archaeon]
MDENNEEKIKEYAGVLASEVFTSVWVYNPGQDFSIKYSPRYGDEETSREVKREFIKTFFRKMLTPLIEEYYENMTDYQNAYKNTYEMDFEAISDKTIFTSKKKYLIAPKSFVFLSY